MPNIHVHYLLVFTLALAVGVLAITPTVFAYDYTFNATTDTYVSNFWKTTNYGSQQSVCYGNETVGAQAGFIEWDLTAYGAINATSISIELKKTSCSWIGDTNKYVKYRMFEVYSGFNENTMTWNNNPCGTNFDNGTACNTTNPYTFNITLSECNGLGYKILDITAWANSALTRSPVLTVAILPIEYNSSGMSVCSYGTNYTSWQPQNQLGLFGTFGVTPTTIPVNETTYGTMIGDFIGTVASFVGEMFGSSVESGKMVIWIALEIVVCTYIAIKSNGKIKSNFIVLLFAVLMVVGAFVGFLPSWITVVFVIIAVALVAMWGTKVFGG